MFDCNKIMYGEEVIYDIANGRNNIFVRPNRCT